MRSHQIKGSNQGNKKEANQKEVVCLCVCVGVGGICVGVCEWGGGKVVDGENGEQSHRETGCQKHRKLKKPKKKGRKVLQHAMRVNRVTSSPTPQRHKTPSPHKKGELTPTTATQQHVCLVGDGLGQGMKEEGIGLVAAVFLFCFSFLFCCVVESKKNQQMKHTHTNLCLQQRFFFVFTSSCFIQEWQMTRSSANDVTVLRYRHLRRNQTEK